MNKLFDYRIPTTLWFRIGCLWFGLMLVITDVAAVVIRVNADRNPVRLNESFTLTFTADSSTDESPDFSGLEPDFEILNQGQGSNISMINGEVTKSVSWTLNLMARKTGRLNVPPILFGQDRSPPLQIEVLDVVRNDPEQDSEILLEGSASPENPYIQAQVIYTVQFLRRVELAQASLTEPVLENAIIQKLDEDRSFSVERNGYQYAVTERRYAIFPQASGRVTIPPLVLQADGLTSRGFGFFNQRNGRMYRIQSKAVTLDVRPVPANFKGDYWFPAEQVILEDRWSNNPPSIRVGEPLTRTLKLTATGAPLSLVPEFGTLRFKGQDGDAFKQYPDQALNEEKKVFSGITSSREQKVALIPASPGNFHTERVEIAWWNTRSGRPEIAKLPKISIQALPSAASAARDSGAQLSKPDDLDVVPSESPNIESSGFIGGATGDRLWLCISVFLALGWGVTLLILVIRKFSSKTKIKPDQTPQAASQGRAVKNLKKACRANVPRAAKDALLAWSAMRWSDSPPGNLGALTKMCDAELAREIHYLSQRLYSREGGVWNGIACWEAFSNFAGRLKKQKQKARGVDLEPLFKI